MKFVFLLIFAFSINVFAAASNEVLIEGTIKSFDKNLVLVTDTFGQSFRVPKKMFPNYVKIVSENTFSFSMPRDTYENLELVKTRK